MAVKVRGIGFVGTRTAHAEAMRNFLTDVLGLEELSVEGADATFFEFTGGDVFAVVDHDEPGRTVGLVVDDLDAAIAELRAAGITSDEIAENSSGRYVHFTAPDGQLYELVEERERRE